MMSSGIREEARVAGGPPEEQEVFSQELISEMDKWGCP